MSVDDRIVVQRPGGRVARQRNAGESGEPQPWRRRAATRAWRTVVGLLAIGVGGAALAATTATPGGDSVVLRAADRRGASLTPGERRAVEEVLLARAREAGVIVCHDGEASPGPSAFRGLCADPGPEVRPFWWDLLLEAPRRRGAAIAAATLRLALSDGPPRSAPEIFLLGPFTLPPDLAAADLRAAALRAVTDSLRSSPELLAWLRGLAARPGLLRARPAGAEAPSDPQHDAPTAEGIPSAGVTPSTATADEVRAWNAELLHILDLLIDGNRREAMERADRMLRETRLPTELAARARELRDKAAAVVAADGKKPADGPIEATFLVRLAVVDKGFGAQGRLLVTREGISFHAGQAATDWSVRWPDLSSASRDAGLWESPFTLLLVQRSGRKRYLSRIDGHGHYLPGGPLLRAIAQAQGAFRRSPGDSDF